MYSIWSILEIEPTTNQKIIQKAYAEKLKVCHPEDNPEEFQNLKEAYQSAISYVREQNARGKNAQILKMDFTRSDFPKRVEKRTNTRNDISQFIVNMGKENPEENKLDSKVENGRKEEVPEYITKLGSADAYLLYEKAIEEYVLRLEQNLIYSNGRANCNAIEELFEDMQFRLVINLDEFLSYFEKEMSYCSYWNQVALRFLISKVNQTMRENTDHNLGRLKRYLESKVDNTNYGKIVVWVIAMAISIYCSVMAIIVNTDVYILNHAPQIQEVCQIVEEQYGIELEEEDIEMKCIKNSDSETREKNPKVVEYNIVYEDEELIYSFTGTYLSKEKLPIDFDLEKDIFAKYIEEYLECKYWPNWKIMYMDAFRIDIQMTSKEDKEAFVEQFTIMMDDLFHDSMMKNSDYVFKMDIKIEGTVESVKISMDKEDYIQKCDMLSEELEYALQDVLLEKAYKEGKYSRDEYWEKKTELLMQEME